ncbi:MAG: hypothetical protein IJR87_02215 [Bacteroidaceae bacterium]|nr:hypothetical protein [Bacteroidaceae bacterium]
MKAKRYLTALAVFISSAVSAQQRTPDQSFDWQSRFDRLYEGAQMRYHFATLQPRKVGKWQKDFRAELKNALGVSRIEEELKDFKPVAQMRDREELDFGIRERWTIWTEPDVPLPCVILRPKNLTGRVPLVITPHGHSANTELYAGVYLSAGDTALVRDGERDIAVQAVKEGYIAIAPAARGFGPTRHPHELRGNATSSCRTLLMNDLLVGRTPIGDRVWDIMKLIDYALENLPVDGKNIIVSGQSGGGTATVFAGAVETRISVSAPACAFCNMTGSIGTIIHCECNYIPGILNLGEMGDVAGLTAPRAFYAICGVQDNIFPIDQVRKAFAETKEIYRRAGAEKDCFLYEGAGGHRYYKAGIWNFVREHLK